MIRHRRREALKLAVGGVAFAAFAPTVLAAVPCGVPGSRTEVRCYRGRPMFFLDSRPYTKPVFETYVPQTKFFRQFAEAGTDVFCFSTNLGAGFGAPTLLGPDQWDFKALDQLAHRVLEANPRGLLLTANTLRPGFSSFYFGEFGTNGYYNIGKWAAENFEAGTKLGSMQTGAIGYFAENVKVY